MQNQIDINPSVKQVFKYYTNPDNIKESWPRSIVKESKNVSGQKNEKGCEMEVTGACMGKRDEMLSEVIQKEQNTRLVISQKEGPFESWESIQENQSSGNNSTEVYHTINYELSTTGKISNFLIGSPAEDKIRPGIQQFDQIVKQIILPRLNYSEKKYYE